MNKDIIDLILFWISIGEKYERLKQDPQKRENSIQLGVTGIILSIIGAALTVGFGILAYYCFAVSGLISILAVILGAICVLAGFMSLVNLMIAGIVHAAYQMKLNKRAIGIVALVINLLLIVIAAILIVIFLMKI